MNPILRLFLFALALSCVGGGTHAQSGYMKTLGSKGVSQAMLLHSNGFVYAFTGYALVKQDPDGPTHWQRMYFKNDTLLHGGAGLVELPTGDLAICLSPTINVPGFRILVVDTSGTFVNGWEYVLWVPGYYGVLDMVTGSNGEFYMIGAGGTDHGVVKVKADGSIGWAYRYQGINSFQRLRSLELVNDTILRMVGIQEAIAGRAIVSHLVDTSGAIISTRSYADTITQVAFPSNIWRQEGSLTLDDGRYYLIAPVDTFGTYPAGLSVQMLDTSGIILWRAWVPFTFSPVGLALMPDNSLVIAHHISEVYVTHLSETGSLLWQNGATGTWIDSPGACVDAVLALPDGTVMLSGAYCTSPGNAFILRSTGLESPCVDLPRPNAPLPYYPVPVPSDSIQAIPLSVTVTPFQAVDSLLFGENYVCGGTVSQPEPPIAEELQVFPNPATDRLIVQGLAAQNGHWQVVDELGRTVRSGSLGTASLEIDTRGLPSGSYVLLITTQDGRVARRFQVLAE